MDIPVGISSLGTPIMSNIIFTAPLKEYRVNESAFENNERLVINDVIVTIELQKNIVKTQLVQPQGYASNPKQPGLSSNKGFVGTVKEYVSLGDYSIKLQGWITSEDMNVFPTEKLENLLEYLTYPGAINMYGKFIDHFDLHQVVVTDYAISEERGFSSQVPFRCSLISDDYLTVKYEPSKSSTYRSYENP